MPFTIMYSLSTAVVSRATVEYGGIVLWHWRQSLSQHKSRRRWLGANGKGSLRHQAARKTTAGWVLGVLYSLVAGGAAVRWDWPTETDLADRRGRASPRAQLRLARLRAVPSMMRSIAMPASMLCNALCMMLHVA